MFSYLRGHKRAATTTGASSSGTGANTAPDPRPTLRPDLATGLPSIPVPADALRARLDDHSQTLQQIQLRSAGAEGNVPGFDGDGFTSVQVSVDEANLMVGPRSAPCLPNRTAETPHFSFPASAHAQKTSSVSIADGQAAPPAARSNLDASQPAAAAAAAAAAAKCELHEVTKTSAATQSSKSAMARLTLLNPKALLAKRRSGQSLKRLSSESLVSSKGSSSRIPSLPDDFDPSIRGKGVHDFSAPRTRIERPLGGLSPLTPLRVQGTETSPVTKPASPTTADAATQTQDIPPAPTSQSPLDARLASQVMREDAVVPLDTHINGSVPAQELLPPAHIAPAEPGQVVAVDLDSREHALTTTGSNNETVKGKYRMLDGHIANIDGHVASIDPESNTANEPLHGVLAGMKDPPSRWASQASRFSFQASNSESAAQERLLEEKHTRREAEASSQVQQDIEWANRMFAEFKASGSYEEAIPGVNVDDEAPNNRADGPADNQPHLYNGKPRSITDSANDTADAGQHFNERKNSTTFDGFSDTFYFDDGVIGNAPVSDLSTLDDSSLISDLSPPSEQLTSQPSSSMLSWEDPKARKKYNGPMRYNSSAFCPPIPTVEGAQLYQTALAEAAMKAAKDGRFDRLDGANGERSPDGPLSDGRTSDGRTSDERTSDEQTSDERGSDVLVEGLSGPSLGPSEASHISRSASGGSPRLFFVGADDDDDDGDDDYDDDDDAGVDDMVAAANAEALANDTDGVYSQEFGFYAHSNGKDGSEYAMGGYLGPIGLDELRRTISVRNAIREPNLTPITEGSEFSTRNSFVSLTGKPFGGPALMSPIAGVSPLAHLNPYELDEDDITFAQLQRLRQGAFGGSSTSLHSAGSSPVSMAPRLGPPSVIPRSVSPAPAPASAPFPGHLFSSSSFPLPPLLPATSPWESPIDDISPTSPIHPSTFPRPRPDSLTQLHSTADGAEPGSSQLKHLRSQSTADDRPATSSAQMPIGNRPQSHGDMPHASGGQSPSTPNAGTLPPPVGPIASPRHSRAGSGADNVTYVRELDAAGAERWVIERRRASSNGKLELVGREFVAAGQI